MSPTTKRAPAVEELDRIKQRCREDIPAENFYDQLRERGLEYGPSFRGLTRIARNGAEALARVEANEFEPALPDACFQLLGVLLADESDLHLPMSIERLSWWSSAQESGWVHARLRESKPGSLVKVGDLTLYDTEGRPSLTVEGLALGRAQRPVADGASAVGKWLHALEWRAHELPPLPEVVTDSGRWLVFADSSGLGQRVAVQLQGFGQETVVVDRGADFSALDFRCRAVIYLWSLDDSLESSTHAALLLTQAVLAQTAAPRMFWVTQGAQVASTRPHQTALWGFVWSWRRASELGSVCVDLDRLPAAGSAGAAGLLAATNGSRDGRYGGMV